MNSPLFAQKMEEYYGLTDMSLLMVDIWSAGNYGEEEESAMRLARPLVFLRSDPTDNGYVRPLEGLRPVVDLNTMTVLRVEEYTSNGQARKNPRSQLGAGENHLCLRDVEVSLLEASYLCTVPCFGPPSLMLFNWRVMGGHQAYPVPPLAGNYSPDRVGPLRPGIKPIQITQPEGPSFAVDGNEVTWQNWKLVVGFNAREGLVLHHVRYVCLITLVTLRPHPKGRVLLTLASAFGPS
jgi:Cu2+-containing amine oxidase